MSERQTQLAEKMTAATNGLVLFDYEPYYTLFDENLKSVDGTEGHTYFFQAILDGTVLDGEFSETNGPILDQAISYFEQRACVLTDIIIALHELQEQASKAATA